MQRKKPDAVVLDSNDNVATVTRTISAGQKISIQSVNERITVVAANNVPGGHKLALVAIPKGGRVIKFGEVIGEATKNISEGEHVHTHNIRSLHGRLNKSQELESPKI